MKTKNAFAFRDFDSSRILQRPFFKNFYFDSDKSDAEILDSLSKATEDSRGVGGVNALTLGKKIYMRLKQHMNVWLNFVI